MQAGAVVKEEVVRALVVLLTNAPELHPYVSRQLYNALATAWAEADLSLIMVAAWWLGELISSRVPLASICGPADQRLAERGVLMAANYGDMRRACGQARCLALPASMAAAGRNGT